MQEPYVHEARLVLTEGDPRAVGAAITGRLCGKCEHPPPCPVAPHYTSIQALKTDDNAKDVRVLFATSREQEADVRGRIAAALASGQFGQARWRLLTDQPGVLSAAEEEHARRIATS